LLSDMAHSHERLEMGSRFDAGNRRSIRFAIMVGLAALLGFAALAVSMSKSGEAAFPGTNGRIAYAYGDGYTASIWTANSDGSAPVKLTSGTDDYDPSYSANGSRIAFDRENGIYVMNADGSGLTQLAGGSNSNSSQTEWQENYQVPHSAKTIPFVRIQTFTSTRHGFSGPSFSPDGSQLAVAEGNGKSVEKSICAVEALEDQECFDYENPEAYSNYEYECVDCTEHIVTINSTTGALTASVTPPSTSNEDYSPTYAANGMIAFTRYGSSGSAIFVVNAPGAAPVQVTSGPDDFAPNFSPDGSRIVFARGGREIGMVGAGGGAVTILSVPPVPGATHTYAYSPAFSPDGSKLAFEREASGSSGRIENGIFTMAVDGSGLAKTIDRGYTPNWQPVPLPPPPPPPPAIPASAKAKKGRVELSKKHKAVVGAVVCGSSPCTLKVLSSSLKIGKKRYSLTSMLAKELAPTKKANVEAIVAGKALAALSKAGKGGLTVKIQITDALGKKVLILKSILIPAKQKRAGQKGKGKKTAH
jgi:dipeptidyl aminopeptidase/acylaminoacyl peptidase